MSVVQQASQKMADLMRNTVSRLTESVYSALLSCANNSESLTSFINCVESIDGKRGEVARAVVMEFVGAALGRQYADWSTFRKSLSNDIYETVKTALLGGAISPALPPPENNAEKKK